MHGDFQAKERASFVDQLPRREVVPQVEGQGE